MTTDVWTGIGFWLTDTSNWSLGAPPTPSEAAEISGTCAVDASGSATAEQVTIDSAAELAFYDNSTLDVTNGIDNAGLFDLLGRGVTVTGGALTNSGSIDIGSAALSLSDTVTVSSLTNTSTGAIILQGASGSGATAQATLDVTGSSSSTIDGAFSVSGDADLELPTGVTAVASASSLQIQGAEARVSLGAGSSNSALSNLSDNAGVIDLEGNVPDGFGGVTLSLNVGLTNASGATFKVDSAASAGGSQVTVGFSEGFANQGSLIIGNSSLGAAGSGGNTIVRTKGPLFNTGSIQILGNAASGATNNAALIVADNAPGAWTGSLQVGGDATLEYLGSGKIKKIDSGSSIELDGGQAQVLTDEGFQSALSRLTANYGTLTLRGGSSLGAGGVSRKTTEPFTNEANANLSVDAGAGDGGSRVAFGGVLTNKGTLDIGNTSLSALTKLTAQGLVNDKTLALAGSSSSLAELIVSGAATTSGEMDIGSGSKLVVTGSNSFTEAGGSTTVEGRLVASTIDADAGKLDFKSAITSGDGVGALDIGTLGAHRGTLEFDSSVDSSHTVDFASSAGTLALGDAHAFAGTIQGFAFNEVIDLLHQTVTNLAYSGSTTQGALTVTLSGGATEKLAFKGDYIGDTFSFGSDGHRGTAITVT
jgi:hypothetical protein